jgi:hypothetical protein
LANTASRAARAAGVNQPRNGDIPPTSCLPSVNPRRRVRPSSLKSPSGFRQSANLSANLPNCSGRYREAKSANCASACPRVSTSTQHGRSRRKPRITLTWPAPIVPSRWATAVAGSASPLPAAPTLVLFNRFRSGWSRPGRAAGRHVVEEPIAVFWLLCGGDAGVLWLDRIRLRSAPRLDRGA